MFLSPTLLNLYGEYFISKVLEVFGDFKVRGRIIGIVKYADNLVLLTKKATVLQGMFDRLQNE